MSNSDGNQISRDKKGRYRPEHNTTPEDLFNYMEHHMPYATSELADEFDIPRRTAYEYLTHLESADRVEKKKINERRVIWMRGG